MSCLSLVSADIRFLASSQGSSITFRNSFRSFLTPRPLLLFPTSVSHFPPAWLGTQGPRVMCGMLSLPGHHLGRGLICCLQKPPWSLGVWDVGTRRLLGDEGQEARGRHRRHSGKAAELHPGVRPSCISSDPKLNKHSAKRKPVC